MSDTMPAKTKRIQATVPMKLLSEIKRLIEDGRYTSVGEFFLTAARKLVDDEKNFEQSQYSKDALKAISLLTKASKGRLTQEDKDLWEKIIKEY